MILKKSLRLAAVATLVFLVLAAFASAAQAQLSRNAINVTAIRVKKLPNATQIRIETDGTVQFGTDLSDFINVDEGFTFKLTQSLRLRLPNARSKVPAFVALDAYPVDSAFVAQGRDVFRNPYFGEGASAGNELNVQVELRFAAPIRIRQFAPDAGRALSFGEILGPLEARVETSIDRRAIIVTVITNRSDALATRRLDRSPRAERHSTLVIGRRKSGRFRLEALHTPLKKVLDSLASSGESAFLLQPEVAELEVSLVLPDASEAELLAALQNGYGLGVRSENGALVIGRGGAFFETRALPLQNLTPDAARLLFPDFLLPFLRADRETNALLVSQTAPLSAKIASDLKRLDAPTAQFEIQVQAWELSDAREINQTLSLTRSVGNASQSIDFGAGIASVQMATGQTDRLNVALNALSVRGRAKLVASVGVTALSGERGNLFLGQTRYIQVLQNRFGGQSAQALALQIGTTLGVTPRGDGQGSAILLDIAPRVSSVDEIEAQTGLPTLGIREVSASVRVREGESLVLAGLDFSSDAKTRRKTLRVLRSKREAGEGRDLLVLVKAKRVGIGGKVAPNRFPLPLAGEG